MSFDEITRKIEIPGLTTQASSNVLPVDFKSKEPRTKAKGKKSVPSLLNQIKDFDVRKPWVLRLIAVVTILILSMLVL